MEIVNQIISYSKDHWVDVLAVIGAIDIALGIIVKWTPTKIDDNIYTMLHNLVEKLPKKK